MDWRPVLDKFIDSPTFEGGVVLKSGQQVLGALRKDPDHPDLYIVNVQPRDKMGDVIEGAPSIDTYFDVNEVCLFQCLVRDSGLIKPKLNLRYK